MTEEDLSRNVKGTIVNDDVCDIASSYDTVISKLMRVEVDCMKKSASLPWHLSCISCLWRRTPFDNSSG